MGPLARKDLVAQLERQVQESMQQGATCLLGGRVPSCDANLYEVTVLDDVEPHHAVFREETFGPVFAITKGATVEELIRLAN